MNLILLRLLLNIIIGIQFSQTNLNLNNLSNFYSRDEFEVYKLATLIQKRIYQIS